MDQDGVQISAEYVIAAYKQRVAELEEQTVMMQALIAQLQQPSGESD